MIKSLREKLMGAWELVSYVEKPLDGSPDSYPLGNAPKGLILYTHDGFMSAQLMLPERENFASGDWFNGTPEEYQAEASTYIAYSGPYEVDENAQTLTHSMTVSLFPNWTGQTQPRVVETDGEVLKLSTATPINSKGKVVMSYLTWHRAKHQRN